MSRRILVPIRGNIRERKTIKSKDKEREGVL